MGFQPRAPNYFLERARSIYLKYRSDDKSLAQPTFRCILFDGENISFDASLVIYIYIYIYIVLIRLLVGRSRDRFPVVSLRIFFRSYPQTHVPWGRLSI
jgi:hypothetical protein